MTDKRIVVLQRGWVAIGDYSATDTECILTNAKIIRRWGTTQGLGELAANGPLPNTKLDPAGILKFHPLSVVVTFTTEAGLWPN